MQWTITESQIQSTLIVKAISLSGEYVDLTDVVWGKEASSRLKYHFCVCVCFEVFLQPR